MYIIQKLKYFYIFYYILILIKSLLVLFKNKKFKNKNIYYIYIYIIFIYIKLYSLIKNIVIKYINNNNKNLIYNIYNNSNYIYFYIYNYNIIKLKNNNNELFKFDNIIEKIISMKIISHTIEKGRIKKYKVIILIGNKCGWIGLGVGKNENINKAIIFARKNALKNIYYFKYSLLNIYKLKFILINSNKFNIKLQFNICNNLNIKFLLVKYLLECLGYLNCKIIIHHNILKNKVNLLNKILLILFDVF